MINQNTNDENEVVILLEQYKVLRQELLFQKRLREQTLLLAGTTFFLLAGFILSLISNNSANQNTSEVVTGSMLADISGAILLFPTSVMLFVYVHRSLAIARINLYIEYYIEKHLPYLQWSKIHWIKQHGLSTKKDFKSPQYFRIIAIGFFFTLLVFSWIIFISLNPNVTDNLNGIQYIILLFQVLISIFYCYILYNFANYETHREKMRTQIMKISEALEKHNN
ncbi:MAG: hypothetical protein DBP02_07700 [gamma proteobacterium symbiont of Ctena orbiculata]|nr:MAG: hypothetical protein DBP02_07700 [gamma proteobacterium symbiont of Ctena orbiculata]